MKDAKHFVLYAHGFGVRKDSRGMFSDIAGVLPGHEHVFLDLNGIADDDEHVVVGSLESQAIRLTAVYEKIRREHPDAIVDLIGHSQGCIIIGLAQLPNVNRIILLASPSDHDATGIQNLFTLRPENSSLDVNGVSELARADGSTTTILPEYWDSLQRVHPIALFRGLSAGSSVHIVSAQNDEILEGVDFAELQDAVSLSTIPGDHNFKGADRAGLLEAVQDSLT